MPDTSCTGRNNYAMAQLLTMAELMGCQVEFRRGSSAAGAGMSANFEIERSTTQQHASIGAQNGIAESMLDHHAADMGAKITEVQDGREMVYVATKIKVGMMENVPRKLRGLSNKIRGASKVKAKRGRNKRVAVGSAEKKLRDYGG
ncbi:hypothetical protein VNO78_08384 [Psophocarpus tetragonolobus]|uniref:Uncharacterized protein n=1 Tax=Psophocarpus tetragonolobus TaxID=3891 RepID=A0AAN9SUW9_PSOTE